jgi:hypothetical protein
MSYYSETTEIQRMFEKDIRDKKRTGRGIHNRKGIRGYVGKVKFAYDIMSRKDKYNHRKGGKITVSNMFDTILPKKEFFELELNDQKNRLAYWQRNNSVKEVQQKMGIAAGTYYKLLDELEIPRERAPRKNAGRKKGKGKTNLNPQKKLPPVEEKKEEKQPEKEEKTVQKLITNGLYLEWNGQYEPGEIQKICDKVNLIVDGEESKYRVHVSISEV